MRVITIPEPVTVSVPRREGSMITFVDEKRTMARVLQEAIDAYDVFAKGHVNGLLYIKLSKILSDADGKTELWFEDADYFKLSDAVEAAHWISPKMNAAYNPFREALKAARTETQAAQKK